MMTFTYGIIFLISSFVLYRIIKSGNESKLSRFFMVLLMIIGFISSLMFIPNVSPWKEGSGLVVLYVIFYLALLLFFANIKTKK